MKRHLRLALKLIGIYVLIVVIYGIFAFASLTNERLATYEQKINPSTFVFWHQGEFYFNPPLFTNLMSDPKGQLSPNEPGSLSEVDIWVLLLEGFENIKDLPLASDLGVDIDIVSRAEAGSTISQKGAALSLRFHFLPLFVNRSHVLILDAKHFREHYRNECLDEIVYGEMIGQRDQELWERCQMR